MTNQTKWKVKDILELNELSDEEKQFIKANNKRRYYGKNVEELKQCISEVKKSVEIDAAHKAEKEKKSLKLKPIVEGIINYMNEFKIDFRIAETDIINEINKSITEEQKRLRKQISELETKKLRSTNKKRNRNS